MSRGGGRDNQSQTDQDNQFAHKTVLGLFLFIFLLAALARISLFCFQGDRRRRRAGPGNGRDDASRNYYHHQRQMMFGDTTNPPAPSGARKLERIQNLVIVRSWSQVRQKDNENNEESAMIELSSQHSRNSSNLDLGYGCCYICLDRFQSKDQLCQSRNTNCTHMFHLSCLAEWLSVHDECPVCRQNYLKQETKETRQIARRTQEEQV